MLIPSPGILITTVADGAGSAAHSQMGARVASDRAAALAAQLLEPGLPSSEDGWRELVVSVFKQTMAALQQESATLALPLAELATTLILV